MHQGTGLGASACQWTRAKGVSLERTCPGAGHWGPRLRRRRRARRGATAPLGPGGTPRGPPPAAAARGRSARWRSRRTRRTPPARPPSTAPPVRHENSRCMFAFWEFGNPLTETHDRLKLFAEEMVNLASRLDAFLEGAAATNGRCSGPRTSMRSHASRCAWNAASRALVHATSAARCAASWSSPSPLPASGCACACQASSRSRATRAPPALPLALPP